MANTPEEDSVASSLIVFESLRSYQVPVEKLGIRVYTGKVCIRRENLLCEVI